MNKTFALCLLLSSLFSMDIKAQEQSKKISQIVVKANNLYQFNQSSLKNHYSLGSEVGIYLQNKFYIGFSQYNSISPSDLSNRNFDTDTKLKSYEYGIVAGYITNLQSTIYLYSGIRAGYGGLQFKENRLDFISKDNSGTIYISPDIKLGIKLSHFISVEAGANYRFHFGKENLKEIKTSDMNGLGITLGLVGNIPL